MPLPRRLAAAGSLALLALLTAACASGATLASDPGSTGAAPAGADLAAADAMPRMHGPLDGDGVFYVPTDDEAHPRLRYVDGQVSQNQSCAVRLGNKLNPRIPPVYVNGQPIGFC